MRTAFLTLPVLPLAVVSALVFGALASVVPFTGVASAEGRAALTTSQLTFGTVTEGEIVERSVVVKNSGDRPIVINRVVTSCGCVIVTPESAEGEPPSPGQSEPIAPGAERKLNVKFDTAGFVGQETKRIHIYTNSPSSSTAARNASSALLIATLTGIVKPLVQIQPTQVFWKNVVRDEREVLSSEDVELTTAPPISFTSVASSSKQVRIEEISRTPHSLKLRVSLLNMPSQTGQASDVRERVLVGISGTKERSSISIPVVARLSGLFTTEPRTVSFGVLSKSGKPVSHGKKGRVQTVQLLRRGARDNNSQSEPVEVKVLETGVQAAISPLGAGVWAVRLEIDPTRIPLGVFKGSAVVSFSKSGRSAPKELSIPYVALIQP